jgi:hypothetical protein
VTWSFGAGQQVTRAWNATVTQSGAAVTATDAGWNATLATNATTTFGFNGSWNSPGNPVPTGFAMNGITCTGRGNGLPVAVAEPHADIHARRGSPVESALVGPGPLMSAKPATGHSIVSVKDPSIVRYNGQWLVYATTADTSGDWLVTVGGPRRRPPSARASA